MKTKIWIVAAFVLTFAAGVLTGAIIVREYGYPPAPPLGRMEDEAGRRHPMRLEALKSLNLSKAQSKQVAEIIDKHQEKLRKHLGQIRPGSHQIIKEMTMAIDSVLTPEQRRKFHEEFPPPFGKMPRRPRAMPKDSPDVKF